MKISFQKSFAQGSITAPPSKSMAHRLLICAGLCDGISKVYGVSLSEDIKATISCLESIGAKCKIQDDKIIVKGAFSGNGEYLEKLNCSESGSTLRFFVPICLAMGGRTVFNGTQRLMNRPLNVYEDICKKQNIRFEKKDDKLVVEGLLKPDQFKIQGDISSQFVSGLLFAMPLLDGNSSLEIIPPIESGSYIDMTLDAIESFGIEYTQKNNVIDIKGGQRYVTRSASVEGDYSNAALLEAYSYVGGNVTVSGLNKFSSQGDKVYKEYFDRLKEGTPTLDISDCPDLGPILFALSACLNGGEFTGTKRLQYKESDRVNAMKEELSKFGINMQCEENRVIVHPSPIVAPKEEISSHNDHRVAMAISLVLSLTGGILNGAEAVKKSYPTFFDTLKKIGINANII